MTPATTIPTLYPHQVAAIEAALLAIRAGAEAGMIVLPTGTGKTGMVLSLGRKLAVPMLFLVHREELLAQTLRAARRFWPEASPTAICAGTRQWDEPDLMTGKPPDLVVSMVPSLVKRLESIDPERFGVVVADECDLAAAPTWEQCLDHFAPGFTLGVTATPARHDGRPLDRFGREPIYSYSLYQAIKDGRLAPLDSRVVKTETNLDQVGKGKDGDVAERQLARACNSPERNATIFEAWCEHALGRPTIAFCVDLPHCEDLAGVFRAGEVRAEAIYGSLHPPERAARIKAFAAGEIEVLVSCDVLTRGFDEPSVSCLLMGRPTQSRPLYVQMVGRGLRLHPGKTDCLLIDFVDNSSKHKLVCAADLMGRKGAHQAEPGKPAAKPEAPERSRQKLLPAAACEWRLETACPWPELPSLEGYAPLAPWQDQPASEGQAKYLAALGLATGELTKGEASYLIDRAREYEAAFPTPATDRQRRWLLERGLWVEGTSKRQASALIDSARTMEGAGA